MNAEQTRDLLAVIDHRDPKGSLLITSQMPVTRWHDLIGGPPLGDAILDRVRNPTVQDQPHPHA